jgi:hypothetical protein
MAAADPAREPALERAMPADAVPGSTIPEDTEAEILLQDGTWAWAQVTGQRKDRHGRWCVGLRWYASPAVGGREGWYLYDPAFIRRPCGQLLHLMVCHRDYFSYCPIFAAALWYAASADG